MSDYIGHIVQMHNLWSTRRERKHLEQVKQAIDTGEIPKATLTEVSQRGVSDDTWDRLYRKIFPSRWKTPKDKPKNSTSRTDLKTLPTVKPYLTVTEALDLLREGKGDQIYLDSNSGTVEWRLKNGG